MQKKSGQRRMLKYARVARTVARRIEQGDYRMREFPSVAQLARELGINPRTVTKAVDELVEQGVLYRDVTGRIDIRRDTQNSSLHIALLQPAFWAPTYTLAQRNIARSVNQRGWQMKVVTYTHWHDPTIPSVLGGFDGVLFLPIAEDVPRDVIRLIKAAKAPVVMIDQDLSEEGIPSLHFYETASLPSLLDPLIKHGHRRIACLNAQPHDSVIRARIQRWQLWLRMHHAEGRLLDDPVKPFESSLERGYRIVDELLKNNDLPETAIFCTNGAAAVGVMRALADHGLTPGKEVSVCAADDHGGEAPFLCPRLTSMAEPDWDPYLQVCLDWFANGGGEWVGPLSVHPTSTPVYLGESVGPAPSRSVA